MVIAVAVKFGVGVALVVAAHFVLVRRWRNGNVKCFDCKEIKKTNSEKKKLFN